MSAFLTMLVFAVLGIVGLVIGFKHQDCRTCFYYADCKLRGRTKKACSYYTVDEKKKGQKNAGIR